MTTNKQAYNRTIIKELSVNYKTVFKYHGQTGLTDIEYDKLVRYLKPKYTYLYDENTVVFARVKQYKEVKLFK